MSTAITQSTPLTPIDRAELKLRTWGFSKKRAEARKLRGALVAELADGLIAIVTVGGAVRLTVCSEWADGARRTSLVLEFDELDELADAIRELRAER